MAKTHQMRRDDQMRTLGATDAKYGFGRLIDLARAAPVAVAKHGRPVVVVMAVEEFERLTARNAPVPAGGEAHGGHTNRSEPADD